MDKPLIVRLILKPYIVVLFSLTVSIGWAQPVIVQQPTNAAVVLGGQVVFNVSVSDAGPFTYTWQLNGTNLPLNKIITTIAGNGTNGFSGDGGVATNAQFSNPSSLAFDSKGNLFVADYSNNRVRKIDTNGIITTFAGTGIFTNSGDGGLATNTGFNRVLSVAIDKADNLLIGESLVGRIRKVDGAGIVSTVAGNGTLGYTGDGGAATNANLNFINAISVDANGNLLIADSARIRKVNTNGIISTVASVIAYGISSDSAGNIYCARSGPVSKIDTNGNVTLFAGNSGGSINYFGDGGTATNAGLRASAVRVAMSGDVFISDDYNSRIRKVDTNGIIITAAGNSTRGYSVDGGQATNASVYLGSLTGLTTDSQGNLFIADTGNHRIRKVSLAGSPSLNLYQVSSNRAAISLGQYNSSNNVYVNLNSSNLTNCGDFSVVISSPSGSVTSSPASLSVLLPPIISIQPTNTAVTNGSSATFSFAAYGNEPLHYQWYESSARAASGDAVMSGRSVARITLKDGGLGYTVAPSVQFFGNNLFPARANSFINNGSVTGTMILNFGSYDAAPLVLFDNPQSVISSTMTGQTNSTLILPNLDTGDSTNYFVVVTNDYGAVTSSMVGLFVYTAPQNFSVSRSGTGLQMQLTGTPGYPYILLATTNLTPPINWLPIATNSPDTTGLWQVAVTNLNLGQRFYRVRAR